jgi:hypothetical protein
MRSSIEVGEYSMQGGIELKWFGDFEIRVSISGTEVAILANPDGLRSLAQHLMSLAQDGVPDGAHVHFEPGLELEDNSASLVLNRGIS